jgi:hypothetical protein
LIILPKRKIASNILLQVPKMLKLKVSKRFKKKNRKKSSAKNVEVKFQKGFKNI